jgi:hypothetical protein
MLKNLFRHLLGRHDFGDTRVVDQNLDRTEAFLNAGHHALDISRFRHIRLHSNRLPPKRFNLAAHIGGCIRAELIIHGNVGPGASQCQSSGLPDAPRAAGHKSDAILKYRHTSNDTSLRAGKEKGPRIGSLSEEFQKLFETQFGLVQNAAKRASRQVEPIVARHRNTKMRLCRMLELSVTSSLMMDFKSSSLQGSQNLPGPQDRKLRTHRTMRRSSICGTAPRPRREWVRRLCASLRYDIEWRLQPSPMPRTVSVQT